MKRSLTKMAIMCRTSEEAMKEKVTMLLGNHSWDSSIRNEAKYTAETVYNKGKILVENNGKLKFSDDAQTGEMLISKPKVEVGYDNGEEIILFVDIHPMGMICLFNEYMTGKEFKDCSFIKKYQEFETREQAKEYLTQFVYALQQLKKNNDIDWRALRLHHPLFNVEGNAEHLSFFWSYQLKSGDTNNDIGVGKSLLELMKEARISFVISGHHHSSHVFGYPYEYTFKEDLRYCDDTIEGKNKFGCVANISLLNNNNEGFKSFKTDEECNNYFKEYKHITYDFDGDVPDTLFNFVSGNGKDRTGKLDNDKKTPGALLWGRALNAGGFKLEVISPLKVNIVYFERVQDTIVDTMTITLRRVIYANSVSKDFDRRVTDYVSSKIINKECTPIKKEKPKEDKPKGDKPKTIFSFLDSLADKTSVAARVYIF
jgi:hypothetical protein